MSTSWDTILQQLRMYAADTAGKITIAFDDMDLVELWPLQQPCSNLIAKHMSACMQGNPACIAKCRSSRVTAYAAGSNVEHYLLLAIHI